MLLCQHLGWDLWGKKVYTESWRLILSLSVIPAVVVLVLIVRLPNTARWLLMNGQREGAADLLRTVEPDMDPDEEVRRIEHDLSYEEKGSFAELFQGRLLLSLNACSRMGDSQ